ncbi:MAG TPA: thioesterase domain-containing protein [Burkholderiaceae bacterium]
MNGRSERRLLEGPAGRIELVLDRPPARAVGVVFIAHPHPLFGGSLDNKVVTTLARAFSALGWLAVRPNFRGVGASEGTYDEGHGESDDLLHLVDLVPRMPDVAAWLPERAPRALAGFSFGSFVAARVARELQQRGQPARHLVLVGAAAGKWPMPAVDADAIVIHGERDETIALSDVFEWARSSDIAVTVIPGADHFFHRRLTLLKRLVVKSLAGSEAERGLAAGTAAQTAAGEPAEAQ